MRALPWQSYPPKDARKVHVLALKVYTQGVSTAAWLDMIC